MTTSVFGMDIISESASFVHFGWVLIASVVLTLVSVFNLKRTRDAFGSFWGSIKTNVAKGSDAHADECSAEEGVPKSNWIYLGPVLWYCLVTLPMSETSSILRSLPFNLQSENTSSNFDTAPHCSNSNLHTTIMDNVPSPRVKPTIPSRSPWKNHRSICQRCILYRSGEQHSENGIRLCGMGKKLLKDEMIHPTPPTPQPTQLPPFASTTEKSNPPKPQIERGIMQDLANVAKIGQVSPAKPVFDGDMRNGRMRPWVKNLGFAILRIIRVAMLPIWVILLVFDYLIILMLLLVSRTFATLTDEHGVTAKKDNPFKYFFQEPIRRIWVEISRDGQSSNVPSEAHDGDLSHSYPGEHTPGCYIKWFRLTVILGSPSKTPRTSCVLSRDKVTFRALHSPRFEKMINRNIRYGSVVVATRSS